MNTESVAGNSQATKLTLFTGGGAVAGALLMYAGLWAAGSLSPADTPAQQPAVAAANGNGAANGHTTPPQIAAAAPALDTAAAEQPADAAVPETSDAAAPAEAAATPESAISEESLEIPDPARDAPKEITVSAITRWQEGRSTDYEGNKIPRDLQLWIYVIGQEAVRAISWGDAQFEAVTSNADEALEPKEIERYGRRNENQFEPIQRSDYGSEHPRHGVRAIVQFPHPRKNTDLLAEVKGSLKLQVAASKKGAIIEKVPSFTGKQVEHRELKALGLTLTLKEKTENFGEKDVTSLVLTVADGNPDVIASVEPVDANGERLSYVNAYSGGSYGDEQVSYQISAGEKKIPDDLRLKLTLNIGLHEVTVPFALTNVRVPPEPDANGQPGTPVEGTPEGIVLASKTRWRDGAGYTYDGKPNPPALLVEVNMTGPTAMKALAWGFVTLAGAEGDGEVPLKLEQERYSQESEAIGSLIRVERNEYYDHLHPDDGVRGMLALEHPPQPISTVKNIQGSLKVRVARETKGAILKDIKSLVGKDIAHEEFKSAGLEFGLANVEKNRLRLTLIQGDPNVIGKVTAIDSEGDVLKDVSISDNRDGQSTFFQVETYEDKFPAGMQLKIDVHKDIEILTVPFHFENLPIPDLPVH